MCTYGESASTPDVHPDSTLMNHSTITYHFFKFECTNYGSTKDVHAGRSATYRWDHNIHPRRAFNTDSRDTVCFPKTLRLSKSKSPRFYTRLWLVARLKLSDYIIVVALVHGLPGAVDGRNTLTS
jgi:hypothetical protein